MDLTLEDILPRTTPLFSRLDLERAQALLLLEKPEPSFTAYVIRRDEPVSTDFLFVSNVTTDQGFVFGAATVDKAHRFPTADAAASAIVLRNEYVARRRRHYAAKAKLSIVPVKVTTTPAVYETKRVEVSPATTTVTL